MRHRDLNVWIGMLAFIGITSESIASSWTCHNAKLTRHVTVFYPETPAPLPCKVYYTKTTENLLPRVLWKAENNEGYCEHKAEEFVERLRSLGWQCSSDSI